MEKEISAFLDNAYGQANAMVANGQAIALSRELEAHLEELINRSESAKGVMTVVLTSLVYKMLHPAQDIRRHQAGISGGYSGRSFDSNYITPFLKAHGFPAMAESGWLTRSLEQKEAYTKSYRGAISPAQLKSAFLELIDHIEHGAPEELNALLTSFLCRLIVAREGKRIVLATPLHFTIDQTITLFNLHFNHQYKYPGASRLPVLAIYALYEVLLGEVERYRGAALLPLERQHSADRQSGRYGDIDITDASGIPIEAIEIKFGIPITTSHVQTAYEKLKESRLRRYYILSTADTCEEEAGMLKEKVREVKQLHGCQVIANGVQGTLRYYLRLVSDPAVVIEHYVRLLGKDADIHYEHREVWNLLQAEVSQK